MTVPEERSATSRRAALAKARQSRRPSRLGDAAGAARRPDVILGSEAGFPGLLLRAWQAARAAPDLARWLQTLLTLGGHVPADVQLRALRLTDEVALRVLGGVSWRDGDRPSPRVLEPGEQPAFLGELGLTTGGQVVVRVPSQGPLADRVDLVGGVVRVPWPRQAVLAYQQEVSGALARQARSVADCREWLAAAGPTGRDDLLEQLKEAARRTAPFVLYQDDKRYTNFRERNTLTGKTLWPGHPDCALSSLEGLPLELWSDSDVVLVACLRLLIRSAGFARVEEANGTQLTLDHVAYLLERTRRTYADVPGGRTVEPAATARIGSLTELAEALGERRRELARSVQLYREIHGPLMHKIERIAGPGGGPARHREEAICDRLRERLPITGGSLEQLGTSLVESPGWLSRPRGGFRTGLESLVYETVGAATDGFDADFAMSRGMRSLTALIRALRERDWVRITRWDLPEFFCCVVPSPAAGRHFGDSPERLADIAWSISARMQYNSWHFLAGNLPRVPEVVARDYFVPPTIPDLAYYSDQHHRGHVAARVRFSIRSPQPVDVLGRTFTGFVDLRLLRCDGQPFDEPDLLAAQRTSAFIARATTLAADLATSGEDIEVTSFDSQWHWETIAGTGPAPAGRAVQMGARIAAA